jgi:hypothetical protein
VAFATEDYPDADATRHLPQGVCNPDKAIKDKEEDVRGAAATALGQIGPDAKRAVPDLIALLKDERKPVRTQAIRALEKIDPETAAHHLICWPRVRGWLG